MGDLEDFQERHGAAWEEITQSPAFGAAMQFLNLAKIAQITALTPEEIESKGKLVLADLVGHLNHENDLMRLSARKEFKFGPSVTEDYPDPAQEAIEQLDGRMDPSPPKQIRPRKNRR